MHPREDFDCTKIQIAPPYERASATLDKIRVKSQQCTAELGI